MKKLFNLMIFAIIGAGAFAQETFRSEIVTNVDVKQNKVYFSKINISRTIPCSVPGTVCRTKSDTTFTAEVFGMTDEFAKYANELNTENYIELYKQGFVNNSFMGNKHEGVLAKHSDENKRFYFKKDFLVKTEPELNAAFLVAFTNVRKISPIIDKKLGILGVETKYFGEIFPSFVMYGFIFWFMSILFSLSDFRRYCSDASTDKKAYNDKVSDDVVGAGTLSFISTAFFVLEIITHDQQMSVWSLTGVIIALLLSVVLGIGRSIKKLRLSIYSHEVFYIVEVMILLLFMFINFAVSKYEDFYTSVYVLMGWSVMFWFFITKMCFRFYKKQHGMTFYQKYFKNIFNKKVTPDPIDATAGSE